MIPEEILAGLRDIHLPAAEASALSGGQYSPWPLAVTATLLLAVIMLRLWRRGAWRRSLERRVDDFIAHPTAGGVRGLLDLRRSLAARGLAVPRLPPECFVRADAVETEVLREAARDLKRLLRP